jgi:hypothetical protein
LIVIKETTEHQQAWEKKPDICLGHAERRWGLLQLTWDSSVYGS